METLNVTINIIRSIKSASTIKVNRHFEDFFSDRIIQSFSQPTLIDSIEHLIKSVDASMQHINQNDFAEFMSASLSLEASAVLFWIRAHPRCVSMVASLRDISEYKKALASIEIKPDDLADNSYMDKQPKYKISISVELLSPLAHGSDTKAGNATLFRRRNTITETGRILNLPFYAGNAIRGQMRDLFADHLLSSLGLTPRKDNPPVNIWFFHVLYAGGVLEEQSKTMDGINKELGKHGSLRTDGLRRLRDMLPSLSILGSALGNKIIPGRIQVGDLRPSCLEWGNGKIPAAQLMEWNFLTRREDHEGRNDDDKHTGMIANTECLKAGATLLGGIDIDNHALELERSALGCGLELLQNRGRLGADNRRGFGKADITISDLPDSKPYLNYLSDNKDKILNYLVEIGALNASS